MSTVNKAQYVPENSICNPYKALPEIFGQSEHFRRWASRLREETELIRHVRKPLPPLLAAGTRVCGFAEGALKLSVPTSAAAAILKQYDPAIQATLATHGYECKSISIRVQPKKSQIMPIKPEMPLPPPPRACLEKIADSLREGRLKDAIGKLLKHSV